MMCEVPSNAILADEFLEYFDGFSIGSNDLTQLTLGLDRDSGLELLAPTSTSATRPSRRCSAAIAACKAQGKYVGICGQGPATTRLRPWLADEGIASISLNPDSVIDTWTLLAQ
jgi:pyruvate,water dikinase